MDDIARMNDTALIAETRRVRAALDRTPDAGLMSRYQFLSREFARRSGATCPEPVIGEAGSGIQPAAGEYSRLDDFEVLEERRRVMNALAALTGRYRAISQEMTRRPALRWMAAS